MRIGVLLPSTVGDVGEYLADASALEGAGVHTLWLGEPSLLPAGGAPGLEPWPLVAGIAAVTHRVRLGTAASAIAAWPPFLFAAQAASLDQLSRGRLVVGAGAGGDPQRFHAPGRAPQAPR